MSICWEDGKRSGIGDNMKGFQVSQPPLHDTIVSASST